MSSVYQNILVINFGQIGDVILSLPALNAIRKKFPNAKITALVGKSAKAIVEMSRFYDEIVSVDRVELRDSSKFWSIGQIIKQVVDIRRRKFDFVIDMHSLNETNLLGFLSGAWTRLFTNRGKRSLDFLSNFRPKPPVFDDNLHIADFYMNALQALDIYDAPTSFRIQPSETELAAVESVFKSCNLTDRKLVGINLGAGNPVRHWELGNFAELAELLTHLDNVSVLVFCGPEEMGMRKEILDQFLPYATIYDQFDLNQLASAFTFLDVLIGNDTGPMHLGAVVGAQVILVMGPLPKFASRGPNVHEIERDETGKSSVETVFQAARNILEK